MQRILVLRASQIRINILLRIIIKRAKLWIANINKQDLGRDDLDNDKIDEITSSKSLANTKGFYVEFLKIEKIYF